MLIESHKHFYLSKNEQWFPDIEFIIHMADPRCFIRLGNQMGILDSFESFLDCIDQLEWIDGKPPEYLETATLRDAWHFYLNEFEIVSDSIF